MEASADLRTAIASPVSVKSFEAQAIFFHHTGVRRDIITFSQHQQIAWDHLRGWDLDFDAPTHHARVCRQKAAQRIHSQPRLVFAPERKTHVHQDQHPDYDDRAPAHRAGWRQIRQPRAVWIEGSGRSDRCSARGKPGEKRPGGWCRKGPGEQRPRPRSGRMARSPGLEVDLNRSQLVDRTGVHTR